MSIIQHFEISLVGKKNQAKEQSRYCSSIAPVIRHSITGNNEIKRESYIIIKISNNNNNININIKKNNINITKKNSIQENETKRS